MNIGSKGKDLILRLLDFNLCHKIFLEYAVWPVYSSGLLCICSSSIPRKARKPTEIGVTRPREMVCRHFTWFFLSVMDSPLYLIEIVFWFCRKRSWFLFLTIRFSVSIWRCLEYQVFSQDCGVFSYFHPSVQEMKTLITYSLCVSCVLFLLVQLPLSCDVIECKWLEPQFRCFCYYDGSLKCICNYICLHDL